ncbi:MAG: FAD-dependent oxidoreductase [Rhodococcus sp. (in: high G+C Gram-positive bacteria)]
MSANQSPAQPRPTVAVIGSGPSGCYTAQFLRKEFPGAEISIFEAMPVPYGLVRYGVAADHQGTKAVTRQFDRMFERSDITFVGNTRIGVDIDFETITDAFDIVVIATGLPDDRALPIPRDEGAHVIGAGRLLRTLNAFPEEAAVSAPPLDGELGDDLIVIGQGNVAVDVVRLLTKPSHHLTGSDINDRARDLLRPTPPKSIRVIGRSPAGNAKFDLAMLRELCSLDSIGIDVDGLDDSAQGPVAELLRQAQQQPPVTTEDAATERTEVTFHFETVPTAVRHADTRTVLDVTGASGETKSFAADAVITAIGFCQADDDRDDVPVAAWSGAHVYRVGWLDRGGRGNIAENRKHAQMVAKTIVADVESGVVASGAPGLAAIEPQLPLTTVGFAGWQAIDEAERGNADAGRCRRKITDLDEMLAIAHAAS